MEEPRVNAVVCRKATKLHRSAIILLNGMKTLIAIALLSLSTFAQSPPCTLGVKNAPAVNGIALGMSRAEVASAYPTLRKAGSNGYIRANALQTKLPFAGVESLEIGFDRGKVWSIYFADKSKDAPSRTLREFSASLSEKHSLPANSWEYIDDRSSAIMRCTGFTVLLGGNVLIRIDDAVIAEARTVLVDTPKRKVFPARSSRS